MDGVDLARVLAFVELGLGPSSGPGDVSTMHPSCCMGIMREEGICPKEDRVVSTDLDSSINEEIRKRLKRTKEQLLVVGPLVQYLTELGWSLEQIVFGKKEWRVPKTPSEASKREKGHSYDGFPCDIVVFDSPRHVGDYRHVLFVMECKQPDEEAGVSQLETYLSNEPHARLGVWANCPDRTAPATFLYRHPSGRMTRKRRSIADLPRPGEKIGPKTQRLTYTDLVVPTEQSLQQIMEHLLDRVVIADSRVTRREEQLDQLCNLLLLKLESDKRAKAAPNEPVFFRPLESAHRTAEVIRREFGRFVNLYPETFSQERDKDIQFSDETIDMCVEELSRYRLLDVGVSAVSVAFQVLRTAALKQGEGQYFTPQPVIEAGVRLLEIDLDDIVIDPACGTGGFLIEAVLDLGRRYPNLGSDLARWAQTHIFGIDKDAIAVKLAKAIMQIIGDGSAHIVRGDSIGTHLWPRDYPVTV